MKTFEQNLEELKMAFQDEAPGYNKKTEELIVQMQTEFQEGAVCPLAQPHKEFINLLRVKAEIPSAFKDWAQGIRDYEIALQLSSSEVKGQDSIDHHAPVARPALEKALSGDSVMSEEVEGKLYMPKSPAKTDVKNWNDDL